MMRQDGSFEAHWATPKAKSDAASSLFAAAPAPDTLSDEERKRFAALLVRIADRRERADFAELFEFYAPRVKAYLLRLGADVVLAEDIAAEVMAAVWLTASEFDPLGTSASTWIFRIARSRRLDACRIPLRPDIDPPQPMVLPTSWRRPPPSEFPLDVEARIRAGLRGLPPEQCEVLRLAFYEGMTYREIARHYALPVRAVDGLVRAALSMLRPTPEAIPTQDATAVLRDPMAHSTRMDAGRWDTGDNP